MGTLAEKIRTIYTCNMTEEELFADLAYRIEQVYNKYFDCEIFLEFHTGRNTQSILQWENQCKEIDKKEIVIHFLIPDKFKRQTIEKWLEENEIIRIWDKRYAIKLNK